MIPYLDLKAQYEGIKGDIGAAIERVGNVWINSENFHSVKLIPNRAIGRDEFREGCGESRKI